MACKYYYKGNWYTREELNEILTSQESGTFYSPNVQNLHVPKGAYKSLLDFKSRLAFILEEKINKINSQLNKTEDIAERKKLLRIKSEMQLRLDGDTKKGIKGLYAEMSELSSVNPAQAIGYYVEQDLDRLERLSKSNNPIDIKEAKGIIDFYYDAGTFESDVENPFFTPDDIFKRDSTGKLTNEIGLDSATIEQFKEWKDKAIYFQNAVTLREREMLQDMVNSDPGIKALTGKKFSYEEIINQDRGFKDVDWVSLWFMDPTQNLFSGQSHLLGQVIHSALSSNIERKSQWNRDVKRKLDDMYDKVYKELSNIEGGKYRLSNTGIIGIKGVSFKLFMQKYKSGRETGRLISPFSEDYLSLAKYDLDVFFSDLRAASAITNYQARSKAFNDAHNKLKNSKRKTSIIIDITKLPEIASNPEFTSFSNQFINDNDVHKNEIISLIGQKEYDKYIKEQTKLIKNYIVERDNLLESILLTNGVTKYENLPDKEKFSFEVKDASINPFMGVKDFYSAIGIKFDNETIHNSGKYNLYIPREFTVIPTVENNQLVFTNTTNSTEFYNEDYKTIRNNPVLYEFHSYAEEVLETIKENLPYELQRKMATGTVLSLKKTTSEMLVDEKTSLLKKVVKAFQKIIEDFKLSWGIMQEGLISDAIIDKKTGKANYKVNSSFLKGNLNLISNKAKLEEIKFLQLYNSTSKNKITRLSGISKIDINTMNEAAIIQIANYLGVNITMAEIFDKKFNKITDITGQYIQPKKIISEFVTHEIVQSQSFDLFKLMKYYSSLAMAYSAREESLPLLEIAKRHFESIKAPMLNNTGKQKTNKFTRKRETNGLRNNAIMQNDDWFNRVALGNYEQPNSKRIGNKTLYTEEEKQLIKQIDKLLETEKDPTKVAQLEYMKNGMGKIITTGSVVDRFLHFIRFLGLGWNIPSAMMNYAEGFISNMVQAASNEFYDGKHIFYAYKVTRWSRLKGITLGKFESQLARKNSVLMSKFNVLIDSKNELQKSSVKTNFSSLEKLNPYYINSSVEFINQSPVMIAMLKTKSIKDKDGNEESVWDALDNNGNLLPNFRTDQNIKNWEKLDGEDYITFKEKLGEAIVKAHGNYSDLRGMKIKSNVMGKIIMTFKTWLTSQMFSRFADEQYNIKSQSFQKGRLKSLTATSGGLYGAVAATVVLGPVGSVLGALAGTAYGHFFGVRADISILQQLKENTTELFKRMVGMPVNLVTGKEVIKLGKGYKSWTGKGAFKAVDEKNMRANITEMALIMQTFMLYLIAKSIFEPDDDEGKTSSKGIFLYNKLGQLMNQATMYIRPATFYKDMVGEAGLIRWLKDVGELGSAINNYVNGDDILQSGDFAGESKLWRSLKKPFLPGILRDPLSFGFKNSSLKEYEANPFSEYFKSDWKQEKEDIKRERAALKLDLINEGFVNKKQIKRILDEVEPTQFQLNKMGMTREEYKKEFNPEEYVLPDIEPEEEKVEESEE